MEEERQAVDSRRKALEKRMRALQAEQQRKEIAKRLMTPEAYERLMNVRLSNHELYVQLLNFIVSMAQSSKITSKLTEEQLKQILARLTYKPEPTIEIKHK